MSGPAQNIRNFAIIAHIDHGKSTLADRLLEMTGTVEARDMKAQLLDSLEIERERGITVKAQTATITYKANDGTKYTLNLIDTPGHVDFSYEVARSLQACEGALLVVDASQGVEAQTLANVYVAIDNDLEIIPVLNKIDLPAADPNRVADEIENDIGIDASGAIPCSAKSGIGITEILDAIVERVPSPVGDSDGPLRALIFDCWFDDYLGVVILMRVVDGCIKKGDEALFINAGHKYRVNRVGVRTPVMVDREELRAGEVGFLICSIKSLHEVQVGETVTTVARPASSPLPGFKEIKPMVYSGIFPVDNHDHDRLKEALEKLHLNDTALVFEPENSAALGFGFRCGFLGLLHMEIVQERLEREYNIELIVTAPTVVYDVHLLTGETIQVQNPTDLPEANKIELIEEPMVELSIFVPAEYLGGVLKLCTEKRGQQQKMEYLSGERVLVKYHLPLNEMVFDFYDKLKSITRGYASMDYELLDYQPSELVRLDILVNNDRVDALSLIVHKDYAYARGKSLVSKMKEQISRQMFDVAIQAAVGSRIIARETVKALRKNVTAKCYGGDITRKRKLLEKQKKGKKRMKMVGQVEIPQEAFLAILKVD